MWYNVTTMKFSKEYKAKIVDEYLKGKSSIQLHHETGHDATTVLNWVRQLGKEVRTDSEASRLRRSFSSPLSPDGIEKRCGRCDQYKPLGDFHPNSTGSGGVHSICRNCQSETKKAEYKLNPEPKKDKQRQGRKENPQRFRQYELKKRFKINLEDFEQRFEKQGRRCAACGSEDSGETPPRTWHIDHDHSCCPSRRKTCGQCIRGILCRWCNMTLGNAKDSPDRLRGLISYLEGYSRGK
jgi:hypothetical protein